MFCPNCGEKIIDNAAFCKKCGAKLDMNDRAQESQEKAEQSPVQSATYQDTPGIQKSEETFKTGGEKNKTEKTNRKSKNKMPLIIGILVLAVIVAVLVWREQIDYVETVKQHKPFAVSQGMPYTYEEVLDKYIVSPEWKENIENSTSQNIERKEANNQETETKRGNISQKKNVKTKKSHAILGVAAALVVLILIIAVIGEIGDSESDDSASVSTTVTTTGVNLSQSYVNEEEGFSFHYPEAWVPVSEEELNAYSESEESTPLVVLANRIEDLPEEDTYIMIFGFEVTQEVKDRLFVSDDEFAEHFDDDDLIIETSITEIDGVPAREITYLQSDGIGGQSYFYIVGTRFYRIDFVWRGETAGNKQRFFDAIMESYTIETEEIVETQENVQDVLLCQGVPIKDLVIFTTTEDIVGYFGEPDIREEGYYGGEDYIYNFGDSSHIDFYILENGSVSGLTASPEIVTINGVNLRQGFDEVNKMLGEDYHAVGGGGPFEVYGWYTNDGCEITCQFSAEGESDEAISVIVEMATN